MKIALAVWGNRISPVFDTSTTVLIVEVANGVELNRSILKIDEVGPIRRPKFLKEQGVNVLICGAITKEVTAACESSELEIIPFICGNVEQIVTAKIKGNSIREMFCMPGSRTQMD